MGAPEHTPAAGDASERFGSASHRRIAVFYVVVTVVAAVALNVLLRLGAEEKAPTPEGGEQSVEPAIDVHHVFWKLLLAAVVIIAASRIVGALFRRIGQPQVMGEIVAGILLGPSLLGAVWPSAQESLFSADVLPFIEVLAELGLVIFMFLIGLELDLGLMKGRGQAAAAVSHASIVIPFVLGVALALAIFSTLGSAEGDFAPFALFLGASMSITAFPVLARILTERGLNKTRLGAVTITCAAIDDVTAWCLLAVVVAVAAASGIGGAVQTVVLAAAFIVFMISVVRPLLGRLASMQDEHGGLTPTILAVVFGGLLLSALATDRIGIHAIFGAFLFGAIMPQQSDFIHDLTARLEDVTLVFLLPLFFAYSGLRTEIGQLGADPQLWLYCLAIIAVAIAGKWGGSAVAARMVGLSWRESLGLGILMNCRGLTELVILNIGLDLGVIPPALFAMLVMMALVTTFMTTPVLGAIYPPEEQKRMIAEEGGALHDGVYRILVHVPSLENAYELVHTALSLARDQDEPAEVILLRTLRTSDSAVRSGLRQESRGERAAGALRPLVEFVQGAGFDAVPLVVSTASVGDSVVRVAAERNPDLVLMSLRKPFLGSRLLGGSLGQVLRDAPADVALLVDPVGNGVALGKGSRVLVPYGHGFHEHAGLDLALRLAKTAGASVRLIGAGDGDDAAHSLAQVAADAYQRSGVWTTADAVPGDVVAPLVRAANDADLVVLAVSETWAEDGRESLGRVRDVVAGSSVTPLLVVRRHGQSARRGPRRWFGRRAEWTEDTGEIDARSPVAASVAERAADLTR